MQSGKSEKMKSLAIKQTRNYKYFIGIDPGVTTGLCVWHKQGKCFPFIGSLSIYEAMEEVKKYAGESFIRVEDARLRKWFGNRSEFKKQGAGSVKRDCKIWEEFLTKIGADFEMIHPRKGLTKHNAASFTRLTGYAGRTSSHARDAALLVYGF